MHQSGQPLISVVIPSRNRCLRLKQALISVHQQTWKNIEIIIVDDASTDETPLFLHEFSKQDNVQIIRNDVAAGGGGARNQGIHAAKGELIAFLDDDDAWVPEKLEKQYALLQKHPEASAISCGFYIERRFLSRLNVTIRSVTEKQQILKANRLGGASMCLTKKEHLLAINGFDPRLRSGQDWDLWIKLFELGVIIASDEALVCYVAHQGVRITGNLSSAYLGRRRIHLHYRRFMSNATRKYTLCELIFYRKVLFANSIFRKFLGFIFIFQLVGFLATLRYSYRYLKYKTSILSS